MAVPKYHILAVGAHMDDCWLGLGGTALKAVRRGHRVTFVTVVGAYECWPVTAGRAAEIKPILSRVAAEAGVGLIALKHDYMRLENNPALVDELAQIVFETKPDLVFCHAEDENNQDHTALGAATRIAVQHGECFVPASRGEFPFCNEIYQYTTGWQATSFAPDMTVDISDVAFEVFELCNNFDDIYQRVHGSPKPARLLSVTDHALGDRQCALSGHARYKFAQSLVFGQGGYGEGFKAYTRMPLEYRRLGKL